MNRFFGKTENIFSDRIIIDGADVNHIKNVLRMGIGQEIMVNGGNNREYLCRISEMGDDVITLEIVDERSSERELPARIHLFQSLPKSDKMELIIQKCVELGVHEIIPVSSKRCVVKLDEKKAGAKIPRWQNISESAAKQSGRSIIPKIHGVMTFKEAVEYASAMDCRIIPYELAEGMETAKSAFDMIKPGTDAAVFIGPEGGFDISEIEYAVESGMIPISLGKRILRTETAGLAVMSIIMYHLEIGE